jgi:hypothetical protein
MNHNNCKRCYAIITIHSLYCRDCRYRIYDYVPKHIPEEQVEKWIMVRKDND